MSQSFDVIIVGAGIMGSCTAFELAKRGLKVALFDKKTIGEGPTGQSSAIVRQHYSNELTARMALHSLRIFQNFEELIGDECGFTPVGFVVLVEEKDHAGLEANVALQQGVGIKTELLPPEALREIMPYMVTSDLVAAAYESESGYADPYLTVNAYARAARQLGVTVYQDTKVIGVRFQGDQVVGIETAKEKLNAPIVLNTAGAWGDQVARMAGVDVPINACRVQVSFFRRPPGHEAAHPVIGDFINTVYFRPETGNLTLVGLIDPGEAKAVVDPDNFNERMDSEFVLDSGECLVRRYPAMEDSESTGGFASLYGITPDWHPVIDQVPAGSGFYVCAGFSGHGFKLGPAVGHMMADMITGESDPEFDPRIFRLSRFAEGQEVRGQYEYSIVG
jgi:glycine/D-amino acid oxidase-like deaminating enzyme